MIYFIQKETVYRRTGNKHIIPALYKIQSDSWEETLKSVPVEFTQTGNFIYYYYSYYI